MKEKGSKGPQKWHLRQPQLFHTDVNKLPPMADTLSFNWKRSVWMRVWVFSSVTENSFSLNCASPPYLETGVRFSSLTRSGPSWAQWLCQALRGPQRGRDGGGPVWDWGLGSGSWDAKGPPSPEPAGTAPIRHVRTTYPMVSGSAGLLFGRPFRAPFFRGGTSCLLLIGARL